MRLILIAAAAWLVIGYSFPAHADEDWTKVGAALGKPGTVVAGGVYRVGLFEAIFTSASTGSL